MRGRFMSDVAKPAAKKYASFAEFYPFYLSEHSERTCRRLHFAGRRSRAGVFVALSSRAIRGGCSRAWSPARLCLAGISSSETSRPRSSAALSFMGECGCLADPDGRIRFEHAGHPGARAARPGIHNHAGSAVLVEFNLAASGYGFGLRASLAPNDAELVQEARRAVNMGLRAPIVTEALGSPAQQSLV